jgi:hypothetical protein
MSALLDILQSIIVGGMIFLMVLYFNFKMHSVSEDVIANSLVQSEVVSISSILESDLHKVGFNFSDNEKIKTAKSDEIKFVSDIDNNGIIDTISYAISDSLEILETNNPNDRNLYRKINNNDPQIIGRINNLQIEYFDSSGNNLNISSLINSAERIKIAAIGINLNIESGYKIEDEYSTSFWRRKFRIKNTH